MQKFLIVMERAESNYVWTGSGWRDLDDACMEPEYALEDALRLMAEIAREMVAAGTWSVTDTLGIAPASEE